jgi:peptidoglycan/xylan/chitin deacetylase (PgdA/CDA1 family)
MSLRSSLQRLKRYVRPRSAAPAILMYHRVASVSLDPWDLAITPEIFDEQMAYLRQKRMPLPLDNFVDRLIAGDLPARAVAVTFDDGYRDNLIHAKPILEKHGIPATLFLATGWVNSPSPFWWDELASMILGSRVPVQIAVRCAAVQLALNWGEPTSIDLAETWKACGQPQTERQIAYLHVWRKLQRASQEDRHSVMVSLREFLGSTYPDPLGMPMTDVEVREFTRGAPLCLGAHTASHPALTSLTADECRSEIQQSQLACGKYTDRVIGTFAYPYGDMNREVRDAVETAAFHCACSTISSRVDRISFDRFALPRIAAVQGPLESFVANLQR